MNLRYITCSDARETTSADGLIKLFAGDPIAELAVQSHPSKMSVGMPRNVWFCKFLGTIKNAPIKMNLAVHVNSEWARLFCARGTIADEMTEWFNLTNQYNEPLIRRWQININKCSDLRFNTNKIAETIANNPDKEFIFQYAPAQRARMRRLNNTGVSFSLLYDTSGGNGVAPKSVLGPVFENHPMGYSGGISPENVAARLDEIARVAQNRNDIWIDAEGKLKVPGDKAMNIELARQYIKNAKRWLAR